MNEEEIMNNDPILTYTIDTYLSGTTFTTVLWNTTDDYTLIWNETTQVDDGYYEINDVGVTISSSSPHGNGGMIAQVRTFIKGVGFGGGGGTPWYLTKEFQIFGAVLTIVGAFVLMYRSERLKDIANDLKKQAKGGRK